MEKRPEFNIVNEHFGSILGEGILIIIIIIFNIFKPHPPPPEETYRTTNDALRAMRSILTAVINGNPAGMREGGEAMQKAGSAFVDKSAQSRL
jgi:hypothetical protein